MKGVLKKRGYSTSVGDEGGFAPSLKSNEEAIEVILEAIQLAGYKAGEEVAIALDPASSEFFDKEKGLYVFKKSDRSEKTSEEMTRFYESWVRQYPIISVSYTHLTPVVSSVKGSTCTTSCRKASLA